MHAWMWACTTLVLACHSPSGSSDASTTTTAPITATATATAAATGTASATATAAATGTVTATATATGTAPATATATAAGSHVDGNHFSIDVAAPAVCGREAECAFTARVTALGDFHVNKEYPYKLKMEDAPGVTFLGKDAAGASTFSKSAGDFALAGEKAGVMTIRYRAAAGAHPVAGTLKLSVCTASACLLEQAKVTATVAAR
jgi:hypothetical protein